MLSSYEPISSIETQAVLGMTYETLTNVHDHYQDVNYNPLDSIAYHDAEEYVRCSGIYQMLKRYIYQGVKDRWGLDLIRYVELPREVHSMMTLVANDVEEERKKAEEEEERKNKEEKEKAKNVSPIVGR